MKKIFLFLLLIVGGLGYSFAQAPSVAVDRDKYRNDTHNFVSWKTTRTGEIDVPWVIATNPDGTNIGGGGGSVTGDVSLHDFTTTGNHLAIDSSGRISINVNGTVAISAASLPLPTGAATSANQTTANTSLSSIDGKLPAQVSGRVPVDPSGVTQPISGAVGGYTVVVGGSFTRPADTTIYASGDLVANSTTAGSVAPITVAAARVNGGTGMIRRVRLTTSSTSLTNASFRIHFYKSSPTFTNGDNGAWLTTESTYLGACDITLDKTFSDAAKGIGSPNIGSEINFDTVGGSVNLYAVVEARAAYTPTSAEVFTLAVEILQN